MTTTIIAIALVAVGFVLSRTRFVRALNSRRFMPVVYAAATIYFAVRAYQGIAGNARVWPHIMLAVFFFAGAVESARASRLFKRS